MIFIPDRVRIGNLDYRVTQTDKTLSLDGRILVGKISFENCTIELSNQRDGQKMEETFWHEVVHGIIKSRSVAIDDEDEEEIVEEFAKGLMQFIHDNKDLFGSVNEMI